jgi:hypothetical protein
MKLKKFNQFIKENLDREFDDMPGADVTSDDNYDSVEDFKRELGDDELKEDDYVLSDEDDDEYHDEESDELEPVDYDGEDDELEPVDYDEEDDNLADVTTDEFDGVDSLSSGDEYEEEEAHEYKGTILMKELADKLGEKVIDNQIHYGDKVINYYSETEKFHIGKQKFNTVEEVLDFLSPREMTDEVETEVVESRRFIKKF